MDMNYNLDIMSKRIFDTLNKTDLIDISNKLKNIKGNTLVTGAGGSYVVAKFVAKVLENKNNIICEAISPRDILYKNLNNYNNIISASYSGNNYGVDVSLSNNLNKYLLSRNKKDGVINLNYINTDIEKSFISLSSTMIPLSIMLNYYLDGNTSIIDEILSKNFNFKFKNKKVYEILSGVDSTVASTFLDSTITEAGLGIPVLHDKYDFCHGRSTLGYVFDTNMIYINKDKELDKLFINELKKYYDDLIILNKCYDDEIINEYYLTYMSIYLCKYMAFIQNKDLSIVNYSEIVKKLYKYKGEM